MSLPRAEYMFVSQILIFDSDLARCRTRYRLRTRSTIFQTEFAFHDALSFERFFYSELPTNFNSRHLRFVALFCVPSLAGTLRISLKRLPLAAVHSRSRSTGSSTISVADLSCLVFYSIDRFFLAGKARKRARKEKQSTIRCCSQSGGRDHTG